MEKKLLIIIVVLLVALLVFQVVLINKLNYMTERMSTNDGHLSDRIDWTVGQIYEVQHMLEDMNPG